MNLAGATKSRNEFGEEETNDIVVRGYSTIGTVSGMGKVTIEAREAVIPEKKIIAYFVRIELETDGDYSQTAGAMIAYDHLAKTLSALERLRRFSIRTDRFAFTEIEYDVDDAKFIVFNDHRGKLMFSVTTGGVSVHFGSLEQLSDIHSLIVRAKAHLDRHKLDG